MDEEKQAVEKAALGEASRNETARKAARILSRSGGGFVVPTAKQKRLLLVEFAKRNLAVYGKAFDIVKLPGTVDLNDPASIEHNIGGIVLCEVKSTSRKLPDDFKGYFFALTTAELLVAQNLKEQFRFVLVNTATGRYVELGLQDLFRRARGIYPTWSVMF